MVLSNPFSIRSIIVYSCSCLLMLLMGPSSCPGAEEGPVTEGVPIVKLSGLTLARNVRFGASTKEVQTDTIMGLAMALEPGESKIRGISKLQFDEIITTSDESLSIHLEQQAVMDRLLNHWMQIIQSNTGAANAPVRRPGQSRPPTEAKANDGKSIVIRLTAPTMSLTGFKTIRGSVSVMAATGKEQALSINPLGQWLNKTIQVKDIPTAFITVKRVVEGQLQLTLSNDFAAMFEDLKAYQSDGKLMASRQMGLNREPGKGCAIYQCSVPDNGSVAITYRARIELVTVPFQFLDVPLPGPNFLPVPDAILPSEPVQP